MVTQKQVYTRDRLFLLLLQCHWTVHIFLLLTTGPIVFPASLKQYDVTEGALQKAFLQSLSGRRDLCWVLKKPVRIGFYRDLHQYLRQWPPAHSASKTAVGTFYLPIDVYFKPGGCPVNLITSIPLYKELRVIQASHLRKLCIMVLITLFST